VYKHRDIVKKMTHWKFLFLNRQRCQKLFGNTLRNRCSKTHSVKLSGLFCISQKCSIFVLSHLRAVQVFGRRCLFEGSFCSFSLFDYCSSCKVIPYLVLHDTIPWNAFQKPRCVTTRERAHQCPTFVNETFLGLANLAQSCRRILVTLS